MKIAVSTTGPSLDARVDPRFGRCPYFLIIETDDLSFEAVENPNVSLGGGAGIQSAQLMADKGVQYVLTGNCGPNAHQTLSAAGINVIVGCSGTVADGINQFKAGQFSTTGEPNVSSKFGMGAGSSSVLNQPEGIQQQPFASGGMGMGRGGGRGMGGGMGQGGGRGKGGGMGRGGGQGQGRATGRGMGQGWGMEPGFAQGSFSAPQPQAQKPAQGNKLTQLKQQAETLSRQMQETQRQIQEMENQEGQPVAIVNAEQCTGCGVCVEICPFGAISLNANQATVDEALCTGCGLCVKECPNSAISLN